MLLREPMPWRRTDEVELERVDELLADLFWARKQIGARLVGH